jgi:hypothetical protein
MTWELLPLEAMRRAIHKNDLQKANRPLLRVSNRVAHNHSIGTV